MFIEKIKNSEEAKQSQIDEPYSNIRQSLRIYKSQGYSLGEIALYIMYIFFIVVPLAIVWALEVYGSTYNLNGEKYYLIFLIFFFLIGIEGIFKLKSGGKSQRNIVFITTDQKLLYCADFNELHRDEGQYDNIPFGRTRKESVIDYYKKERETIDVQKEINSYINSNEMRQMLDLVINHEGEGKYQWVVKKMNAPRIVRKRLGGVWISYWDDIKECQTKIELSKRNEGFDEICQLIEQKNRG